MVDPSEASYFGFGLHDRRRRTYLAALEDDIHRVAEIVEAEDARCVVVSRVLTEPVGVLRLAVQHRHVGYYAAVDALDAGFLYRLDPLIEERRPAFPSQGGVASSADV